MSKCTCNRSPNGQCIGWHRLTQEQYEQSKQITFRLLYGHIEKEFLKIPFFIIKIPKSYLFTNS